MPLFKNSDVRIESENAAYYFVIARQTAGSRCTTYKLVSGPVHLPDRLMRLTDSRYKIWDVFHLTTGHIASTKLSLAMSLYVYFVSEAMNMFTQFHKDVSSTPHGLGSPSHQHFEII
jgi:hypothetical protein